MIDLKFKLNKSDRFHVTDEYISNGHWLVSRKVLKNPHLDKPIRKVFEKTVHLSPGRYNEGLDRGPESNIAAVDLKRLIPSKLSYEAATITEEGFVANATKDSHTGLLKSMGVKLKSENKIAWIDVTYLPLVQCAIGAGNQIFIKDELTPVIIDVAGEFFAIIMPMRGPAPVTWKVPGSI